MLSLTGKRLPLQMHYNQVGFLVFYGPQILPNK